MTKGILDETAEKVREDIQFLLTLIPATDPSQVVQGLAPMFYMTGTYEGDVELVTRIKEICERYNIAQNDDDEDFEELSS